MKQTHLTEALSLYAEDISLREHPSLKALREATAHLQLAVMQSSPMQVQFLQFLIRSIRAKRVLEIGTYTGYATLGMALALPEDGQMITCDINETWTSHAIPFWENAQQTHKIKLILAPALETLSTFTEPFDFIFIDADKTSYVDYYEYALKLIQPRGIIAIDNIFWDGQVIDKHDISAQTREIKRLNQRIKTDNRVDTALIPIGDGVFLIKLRE